MTLNSCVRYVAYKESGAKSLRHGDDLRGNVDSYMGVTTVLTKQDISKAMDPARTRSSHDEGVDRSDAVDQSRRY